MAKVEILEIDAKQGEVTLKQLRKDIIALKNELLNLEEGTEDYNKALSELGNKQFVIREINEQARASASDIGEMVGNASNFASGLVSAFQGVTASLNLMGIESEDTMKILAQMQNLMALTQGLQGIDDGIKAFGRLKNQINVGTKSLGGFKKALIGTGLGALVVVLGSIIANWEEFTKGLGISEDALKKFGDTFNGIKASITNFIGGSGKALVKLLTGDLAGAKEAFSEAINFKESFENGYNERIIEETRIAEEEKQKIIDEKNAERLKKQKEYIEEQKRLKQQELEEIQKIEDDIENSKKSPLEKLEDEYKQRLELYKKYGKDTANLTAQFNEDVERLNNESRLKEEQAEQQRLDQEKQKRQQEYQDKNTELQIAYETSRAILAEQYATDLIDKETYENTLQALERTTLEKQKENLQTLLADENLTKEERLKLQTELNNTIIALADTRTKAEIESGKKTSLVLSEEARQNASTVDMFAGGINDLLGAVSQNLKEGSKEWKAVNIAMATISMLQGVVSAMTSAFSPANAYLTIWGQIALAGITTATVIASGIANISKIKNTKEDSGGGTTTPDTPNIAGGGSAGSLSTNISGMSNLDSAITSGTMIGETVSSNINNQKVYVTETDITNTQKKVDVIETETTF